MPEWWYGEPTGFPTGNMLEDKVDLLRRFATHQLEGEEQQEGRRLFQGQDEESERVKEEFVRLLAERRSAIAALLGGHLQADERQQLVQELKDPHSFASIERRDLLRMAQKIPEFTRLRGYEGFAPAETLKERLERECQE